MNATLTSNSPEPETPQSQCPKCGAWIDDFDGFGVLAHGACGYCCHPSSTGGVCGICGAWSGLEANKVLLENHDAVSVRGNLATVADQIGGRWIKVNYGTIEEPDHKWHDRSEVKFIRRELLWSAFREGR